MRVKSYLILFILLLAYGNASSTDSSLTKEASFWSWFSKNEDNIIGIIDNQSFATTLKARMEEYYRVLTFELGPADNGKYNFYISCDGLLEGLTYVELLGTAAPELPKWNIIKYKQAQKTVKDIMIDGLRLGPGDITIAYAIQNKTIDLELYIDGFTEKDERYAHICSLLLPALIGEYVMMTKVGTVSLKSSRDSDPNKEIIQFSELKNVVNSL